MLRAMCSKHGVFVFSGARINGLSLDQDAIFLIYFSGPIVYH